MKAFADLANLPEDDRIRVIAAAAAQGEIVGFVVEDDAKADRYVRKLAAFPVRYIDRTPLNVDDEHKPGCPRRGGILVRVGPRES